MKRPLISSEKTKPLWAAKSMISWGPSSDNWSLNDWSSLALSMKACNAVLLIAWWLLQYLYLEKRIKWWLVVELQLLLAWVRIYEFCSCVACCRLSVDVLSPKAPVLTALFGLISKLCSWLTIQDLYHRFASIKFFKWLTARHEGKEGKRICVWWFAWHGNTLPESLRRILFEV